MSYLLITPLVLLCACALYTLWRVLQIAKKFKPDGRFATVDGVRLHYHFYPASADDLHAPVLVFLHGASGNAYDTRLAFLEALRGRYALLFIDRPGLGFSEIQAKGQYTPGEQAKVIAGLLEKLEVTSAVVVGHSLGGSVAAALGLATPDRVKGLAFLAPVSHPWPVGVNWYYSVASTPLIGRLFCWTLTLPIAERLAPCAITSVFAPDDPPEHYLSETRVPLLFRPGAFRANALNITVLKKAVTEQSKDYGALDQPTLIVTGTQDSVVWPSIHCEGLLTSLPDAELMVLDGAGHMPHHTHTQKVAHGLERLVCRVMAGEEADSRPESRQKAMERA
ncbi:MAG: alpha/beta hydrolase [Pseudomonadota bacterium]